MFKKIFGISLFFIFLLPLYAEETKFIEGMKQVDFAKLLIKETNLEKSLSSSPTEDEYFKLLLDFGIEPKNGWNKEGIITREDLLYMLDYTEEEAEGIGFEELCNQLVSILKEISSYNYEEPNYLPEE